MSLRAAHFDSTKAWTRTDFFPNARRYCDYVVKAFKLEDAPFRLFIAEQILADLLPADKPGAIGEARNRCQRRYITLG